MKVLLIDTFYKGFLNGVYSRQQDLANRSFLEQSNYLDGTFFPTANYWKSPLEKLGHEVFSIAANNPFAQLRWCIENDRQDIARQCADKYSYGGVSVGYGNQQSWVKAITAEQIRTFRPDILYSVDLNIFDSEFLDGVRPYYGIAVGQHAAALPRHCLRKYDLIVSSLPNQVAHFRSLGIRSEYLRLAFDHRLLSHLKSNSKLYGLSFLGQVSQDHLRRIALLRELAKNIELDFWGPKGWEGNEIAQMRVNWRQPCWGLDMYQNMRDSCMVFNCHIDVSGDYANNLRLFEVTGVGSMLLNDWKSNLNDMFDVGCEVVAYRDADECVRLAKYYLEHHEEREAIAAAGQARVLREHTFDRRAVELCDILQNFGT